MRDRDLTCACQDNMGEWWETHLCAIDGEADRTGGRGYAGLLLQAVLREAQIAGATVAGLIAVAKAEALYERAGGIQWAGCRFSTCPRPGPWPARGQANG